LALRRQKKETKQLSKKKSKKVSSFQAVPRRRMREQNAVATTNVKRSMNTELGSPLSDAWD
jgi:uncharacterized caspase-like protein